MGRPLRKNFDGGWYHAFNHGAGNLNVFNTDQQRHVFLALLQKMIKTYQIQIHAYCLMSNHYHLLIKTPQGNISDMMRDLMGSYARFFNKAEKRKGPLFQNRFKAIIISEYKYLLALSRYIHLNPIKAGLIDAAENYRWSSFRSYIGKRNKHDSWLNTEKILSHFKRGNQLSAYKRFVYMEESQYDFEPIFQDTSIRSDMNFEEIWKKLKKQSLNSAELLERGEKNNPKISLFKLANIIANYYAIPPIKIKLKGRKNPRNFARIMFMYFAHYDYHYTLTEIANYLGNIVTDSVSKIIGRLIKEMRINKKLQQDKSNLKKLFN
jgi:putative transposase